MADHLFALGLLASLLWLAAALGLRLVRSVLRTSALELESLLFSLGLGLGGLAYVVLACGLLGLLQPWMLALVLAALVVALRLELAELARALPSLGRAWLAQRRELRQLPILRLTLPLAEGLVVLLAVRALAPPIGYDALLYHLAAPKEFLRLGRLVPLPELQQANMPFTVEMLYLLGLAFGSDELANLLHLCFAVLTTLATFSFGRRFFSARVGMVAAALLVSAPVFTYYASQANVDLGWAYFDFLAVYAFAIWARDGQGRWLVGAGLLAGLSLGSKYLGLLTFAAIALGIVLEAGRRPSRLLALGLLFGLPAILTASPWYLKNWLWLGSPVWPLLAPDQAPALDQYFARNMNSGREILDYLLLPARIFLDGSVEYPGAVPSYLLLLVPLYALMRKHRLVSYLLALSALHFAVWSQGIQTIRYLMPIFPGLSLIVAYLLDRMTEHSSGRALNRSLLSSLVVLAMVPGTVVLVSTLRTEQPFAQLLGLESRQAYLSRNVPDYGALGYLNEHRVEISRVLVIGAARRFYLTPPALIDQGLDVASELQLVGEPRDAVGQLQRAGVSHILVSRDHFVFLARFDPEQRVLHWLQAFERARPAYLIPAYASEAASVYRVADAVAERIRQ